MQNGIQFSLEGRLFELIHACTSVSTYQSRPIKGLFRVFGKILENVFLSNETGAFLDHCYRSNQSVSGTFSIELWRGMPIHVQTCLGVSWILVVGLGGMVNSKETKVFPQLNTL